MTAPRPTTGATAAGEDRKRPIWPWLLLAALIAALLLWWLIATLTDDDDEIDVDATGGTAIEETVDPTEGTDGASGSDTTTANPPADTDTGIGLGTVLIGDLDVLDPAVDLSASAGEPVRADTVTVQAVVADEAFYVGPEAGRTILVRLEAFAGADGAESPFEVQEGDTVSFEGTLEQIDEEFLSELRLYDPAAQLETGDFYVQSSETTLAG